MDNEEKKSDDQKVSRRNAIKTATVGVAATLAGAKASAQSVDLQQFGYIEDLSTLRQFNLNVQRELVDDEFARENFLADPQSFLRDRGVDLPSEAFPSTDELRFVMTQHGMFTPDPNNPGLPDPNDPFAPDPTIAGRDGPGPVAIAVCAVVV